MAKIDPKHVSRLEKILKHLTDEMTAVPIETCPDLNSGNYELIYEQTTEYHSSIFDETSRIPLSQSPAYGFFLKNSKGEKRMIMYVLKPDVVKRIKDEHINHEYQIKGLASRNIPKCYNELNKKK